MRIFEKRRDTAKTDSERKMYAAKAATYAKQKRQLELAAVAEGSSLQAFERAAALCHRIQAEASVKNHKAVTDLSAQYKSAYPNGPCTDTISALLAQIPTAETSDEPYEE